MMKMRNFLPNKCAGSGIRDRGTGKISYRILIPDPGGKRAPDPVMGPNLIKFCGCDTATLILDSICVKFDNKNFFSQFIL
jgi:hypothetical protein